MYNTTIVNLFGGPGTGKSTNAAKIFYEMKRRNMAVELALEWIKPQVFEDRRHVMQCQPYVFGKQYYSLHRLLGKVEYIITDSPIFLSLLYADPSLPDSFQQSCVDLFKQMNNLNMFVVREKPYMKLGRTQTEEEAKGLDQRLLGLFAEHSVDYVVTRDPCRTLTEMEIIK